jgi:hypothetical protein
LFKAERSQVEEMHLEAGEAGRAVCSEAFRPSDLRRWSVDESLGSQRSAHPPSAGAGRVRNRGHRQQFPAGLPVIFSLQRLEDELFCPGCDFFLAPRPPALFDGVVYETQRLPTPPVRLRMVTPSTSCSAHWPRELRRMIGILKASGS